jgi:sulfate permease, SulP family
MTGTVLTSDLVAAVIVTIMLIPQSLAYAMLAGLPPEVGLYASILPIIAYAICSAPAGRWRSGRSR